MSNIRQVIDDTYPLTRRKINQDIGEYSPDKPCCIGALLAFHFGVYQMSNRDFMRGKKAFAKALGGNTAQVIQMLRNAGAGYEPFGGDKWPIPHKKVWDRLKEVESFPSLNSEYFRDQDFYRQSFEGLNLTSASFISCIFDKATLKNAKLHYTAFSRSHMDDTNFQGAELIDVQFGHVSLNRADFRGAMIQDCDFTVARSTDGILFDKEHYYEKFNNKLIGDE